MISGRSTVAALNNQYMYLYDPVHHSKITIGHEKRTRLPRWFQKSDVSCFVVIIVSDRVHLNSHMLKSDQDLAETTGSTCNAAVDVLLIHSPGLEY